MSDAKARIEERRKQRDPGSEAGQSFLIRTRGYLDALVFAYLLAMFIRSFVFELFMIPTGSMTPTLIGDHAGEVAFADYDDDGVTDVVYTSAHQGRQNTLHIYLMKEDGTYRDQIFLSDVSYQLTAGLRESSIARKDMILVNKFSYWFSNPDRGDIAVFKVPHRPEYNAPFDPLKPVYIKRVMGLPGELLEIQPASVARFPEGDPRRMGTKWGGIEHHIAAAPMLADGVPATGAHYAHVMHFPRGSNAYPPVGTRQTDELALDDHSVAMIGDNAASSSDSRYWGTVPVNQLRGKAVLRYKPLSAFGFLE